MNKYYAKKQLKSYEAQLESATNVTKKIDALIAERVRNGTYASAEEGYEQYKGFYEVEAKVRQRLQEKIDYYKEKLNEHEI